ncbi:MAG: hypothetical protein HC802_15745, partial [Caldilineaceae bacterium]|nr:hypothetical protein [Caldilineaceae bacterium]
MSAVASTLENYAFQLRNNRLGLWLFFASEAFLFGGLLATRFYLWEGHRPELDQVVGLIVTAVLLLSSFSMNLAETAMEHGDRKTFSRGMIFTAILGTIFLFGVMIFEWGLFPFIYEAHLKPSDGVFGAVVFAMTGMHALHMVVGIGIMLVMIPLALKGIATAEDARIAVEHGVEAVYVSNHGGRQLDHGRGSIDVLPEVVDAV